VDPVVAGAAEEARVRRLGAGAGDAHDEAVGVAVAVTLVSEGQVPDAVWEQASGEFSPEELAALLFAIVAINGYNRLAIATRMEVGGYQPAPVSE